MIEPDDPGRGLWMVAVIVVVMIALALWACVTLTGVLR